ncbi:TPA_asm: fusion protein [Gymnadenia rhellicani amalgavirus 1]|nr:polyprotein [Gymnadenia amalgavirus 1]DAZ91015.1 TPA_asm: fusion protein [Gymnadenia rhellicani amalgavirus 1]
MAPKSARAISGLLESTEELSVRLDKRLDSYRNIGLRFKEIDYQRFLNLSLTYPDVEKMLRFLDGFVQQGTLLSVLTHAEVAGVIYSKAALEARDLVFLYDWLKGPEGTAVTRKIQLDKKLTKGSLPTQAPRDVAYSRLLDSMNIDLSVALKEERQKIDAEIADYMTIIEQRKDDLNKFEEKKKAEYAAAANFPPLKLRELRDLCWRKYQDKCVADGIDPIPHTSENVQRITDELRSEVNQEVIAKYCEDETVRKQLLKYGKMKIKHLRKLKRKRETNRFVAFSRPLLVKRLLRHPLSLRQRMIKAIPVGKVMRDPSMLRCYPLSAENLDARLCRKRTSGLRRKPPIPRQLELNCPPIERLLKNARVKVLRSIGKVPMHQIPVARSKWETGVRHIIGGGELADWNTANNMYRGGGNIFDALRIYANADCSSSYTLLRDVCSLSAAREILGLPTGLRVPDGFESTKMRNFNDDATAGPVLRSYGVKSKYGLKGMIEGYCWRWYNRVANAEFEAARLPFFLARVGYRSKLVTAPEAFEKLAADLPIGRAVMMLDATEQSFTSPLYNVLSPIISKLHHDKQMGWRNYLIRASSDWGKLWQEIQEASCVVELDWSKFDRERPDEDISFMIDVFCSCFTAKSGREERLLAAYKLMMQRSLLVKVLMLDNGGCFQFSGMIPSGSLWTGVLGTGLNILYITCALRRIGVERSAFSPKCAGDDNLTLFYGNILEKRIRKLRVLLNEMFRAGIKEEDFMVHYPPYHVTTEQAVFKAGVNLSLGTSKILHKAKWVQFDDKLHINEGEGLSHRWRYNFYKKPKFLANYFLSDGRSIRPAKDNLEKLLWPEGIHKRIVDYEAALMSMVVDNPWNHHNVNHLMHRYCIVQQIKRQAFDMTDEDVMKIAAMRESAGGAAAYPMIAYWRRQAKKVHMDQVPELRPYLRTFRDFVTMVSTLYSRRAQGGIDAWQYMEIIRGERSLGNGQFGNDILDWCRFLGEHPLSRELRPARRFREHKSEVQADSNAIEGFCRMARELEDFYLSEDCREVVQLADVIGNKLYQSFVMNNVCL